jgi:hypothetical protein
VARVTGQTVILVGASQRAFAKRLIDVAPINAVVNIREATRTTDQSAKMWAMLGDISRAKPDGRRYTADDWKARFMHACDWEVQFLEGLDGRPFPAGFRSSKLSVKQMADLITFIQEYGDRHNVKWSNEDGI